jgi:hypothetical protein
MFTYDGHGCFDNMSASSDADQHRLIGRRGIPPARVEREAIAFCQTAAHLFSSGLYRDGELRPPQARTPQGTRPGSTGGAVAR